MEKTINNLRVIYIMWIRQLKKHYRSKTRVIASVGQPILFLVALGFGFGPIYSRAGEGDYIQFLAPGIISMSILFTAVFNGIGIIYDKQFGFLKETLVAPISRFIIMIGRSMGGATVAFFQGLIIFLLSMIVGFRPTSFFGFLYALVFMFLVAFLFSIAGTALATFFDDMHGFPIVMNLVIMPLFFLSGALFPLKDLSSGIHIAASLNPLSYGVDGIRGAMVGEMYYGFTNDFAVLFFVTLVLLFFGSKLFNKIEI